jgi:uncharacterized protein with HEPN domain
MSKQVKIDIPQEQLGKFCQRHHKDLDHERILNLAVVRLLEIIGEAANKIPREECLKYPEIPWNAMVSMRNRLIHAYGDIDLDIVWQVVKENLSILIEQLKVIIATWELEDE